MGLIVETEGQSAHDKQGGIAALRRTTFAIFTTSETPKRGSLPRLETLVAGRAGVKAWSSLGLDIYNSQWFEDYGSYRRSLSKSTSPDLKSRVNCCCNEPSVCAPRPVDKAPEKPKTI